MSLKSEILIEAYRLASQPWRWLRQWRWTRSGRYPIVVLFYHRVADTNPTDWTISRAGFAQQVDWLQKHFELLSMDEVHQRMRKGYNDRPSVAITFDDGYAENMDYALPMLAERKIPCMYYVSTSFILNQTYFPHDEQLGLQLQPNSVRDLKRIVQWGLDIGAHTRTHLDIGKVTDVQQLEYELGGCRRELINLLNVPVEHFAFPYGQSHNFTAQAIEVARRLGYKTVSAAYGGYNHLGDDPFFIQRVHGDPSLTRIKNWVTLDPRWTGLHPDPAWLSAAKHTTAEAFRPWSDANPTASEEAWRPTLTSSASSTATTETCGTATRSAIPTSLFEHSPQQPGSNSVFISGR
ncbi:MAG: polysaccharide deacetylase family protein [Planctomycetaceae bacterium]|nr:polysaccharide deacetylase family protein [Planctomycetaceae bacterium]